MNVEKEVKKLINTFQTRNPFKIAKYLKINIIYGDYGNTKGFYKKILKRKFIFLNNNLTSFEKKVVCAHELAHSILHCNNNLQFLIDHTNILKRGALEKEANDFVKFLLFEEEYLDKIELKNLSISTIENILNEKK